MLFHTIQQLCETFREKNISRLWSTHRTGDKAVILIIMLMFLFFQPTADISKDYLLSTLPTVVEANLDKGVRHTCIIQFCDLNHRHTIMENRLK